MLVHLNKLNQAKHYEDTISEIITSYKNQSSVDQRRQRNISLYYTNKTL